MLGDSLANWRSMARYFRLRPKKRADVRPPKPLRLKPREPQRSRETLRRIFKSQARADQAQKRRVLGSTRALSVLKRERRSADTRKYEFYEEPPAIVPLSQIRDILHGGFEQPKKTTCQKRHERIEVLFAKGIAGKAGGSPGRKGTYHRTPDSSQSCERD